MNARFFPRKFFATVVVLAGFGFFANGEAQIIFTGLGPNTIIASDVSDDGAVAVGFGGGYRGFHWAAATGAISLNPAPAMIASYVYVSGDGKSVVATDFAGSPRAFMWSSSGGLQYLDVPPGAKASYAGGISGDGGTIVGSVDFGNGPVPYYWTPAKGPVQIGSGAGIDRGLNSAVSFDGSVIAGTGGDANGHNVAFRWTESTGRILLDTLGDGISLGRGMNSDGSILVGGYFDSSGNQWRGFRWTEDEGMVNLENISRFVNAEAFAVSDDGSVIVGGYDGGGFIWTQNSGMRDLLNVLNHDYGIANQTKDWTYLQPYAVSPNGRYVVGGGNLGGWLLDRGLDAPPIAAGLTPVPEPSTYGAMGSLVLLGLAGWRHKKRDKFASS